jgi:WhiB family redox-sensing transcriptional regulator
MVYEWMDDALCRQVDSEVFVPSESSGVAHQIQAAKAICGRCPVIGYCRDYTLRLWSQGRLQGVWAGMSPEEIAKAAKGAA